MKLGKKQDENDRREPKNGQEIGAKPLEKEQAGADISGEPEMNEELMTEKPAHPKAQEDLTAKKVAELTQDLQRTRADFENFRKQTEAQRQTAVEAAKRQTVYKLLPIVDDMGRAMDTYPEQLEPLKKSFEKAMKELGLTEIEAQPGTEFNPEIHEAMMVEGEGASEVVSEVLRPGYYYEGEVLRPAMVKVKYQ